MKSLTFNGIRKDWLYLLEGRQKAPFAPITRNLLKIPGRPGALLQSSEIEPLVIYQPIGFIVKDDMDALTKKDELASWLVTMEPVALEFDDEPGRIYYAVVQNTISDYEKFVRQRRGIIEFLVLDGFGYGPEHEVTFPSDVVTLTNKGTADADPIFELEVKQPVTFAMIQNQDNEYMMIGKPVDETINEPVIEYERIINTGMGSMVGWTHTNTVEDGYAQGEMDTSGISFYAKSMGTHRPGAFYGPSVKTSVPQAPLSDFMVEVLITFNSFQNANQCGRIAMFLLDESDNVIAKLSLQDTYPQSKLARGIVRIGDNTVNNHMINEESQYWSDFYGLLRIMKKNNYWVAYIFELAEDGTHHTRRYVSWVDTENHFTNKKLAQIQLHIASWDITDIPTMWIHHLNAWKINPKTDTQIPYIAEEGDIITFDHVNKNILINGESRKDLKDFGSQYFKLKRGKNQLIIMPEDSFDVTCKYRERYR